MASGEFIIAGIHAFTLASANLVHLAAESRSVVEKGFQCLCLLLYLSLPCFCSITI